MSRETWIAIAVIVGIVALLTLYGAIRLGRKLFTTKRMLAEVGGGGKFAFYAALIYTIFPVDLLPDPIYLDDMAVLGGALFYLTKLLRDRQAGRVRAALPRGRTAASTPAGRPGGRRPA